VTVKPDEAFVRGRVFFSDAVHQLSAEDWHRASPCADWRALDVLGHVGQATRFGTQLLLGAQPAWSPVDPPGALVEGVPATWWDDLADQARGAVGGVDLAQVVDSPAGPRSIADGLSFPALDLYVHGWDVARSGGADLVIPAEAIDFAHAVIDPAPAGQIRNARVFAAEQPAPAGATPSEAFLAWTGRDPAWRPWT
jgi:uncharacterized protein (TIGR03086 family)